MEVTLNINAVNQTQRPLSEAAKGLKQIGENAKGFAKTLTGPFVRGAKLAKENLVDLGRKASEAGKDFKELAGKAAELGAKLLATAAALTYGFKAVFVDIAAEAEECGRLLSASLGSDMGADAIKGVRAFADATGQELRTVTEAYLALNRGGIQPTEEHLRAVADLAAAHGKSMTEVAQSFQNTLKGQAGGLEEFGVKSEQIGQRLLFTYTNQQGELIRLAAKANDPENLNKILAQISQDKAGGAEEERGKTFIGMISRLKSAWAEFRTLVMDSGPFAFLKEQLNKVLEWVNKLKENGSLKALAQEWGGKLTQALKKVKDGLVAVYDWFKRWQPTIATVYQKIGGFKTIAVALGAFLGGPLVAALVKAIGSFKAFGAAMLTSPVGIILAISGGVLALLNHLGALDPLIEGVKAGFSAMSDVLGKAFQAVLTNLSELFGDIGLALTDANGEINPQAWRELGEAIGTFTGGALADLLGAMAKAIGLLHDLGAGLGTVAGSLMFGDTNEQQQRNMERGARNEQIQLLRRQGKHEEANKLVLENQAAEMDYKMDDADKGPTVGLGRGGVPMDVQRKLQTASTQEYRDLKGDTQAARAVAQASKPQEVKTEMTIKLTGTLPEGFSVSASSSDPNTKVSDKTKQDMGYKAP